MATITTVPASEIEPALTAALMRLVEKEIARRGFVIVEHEPSGRFFQFCTELGTRKLLYDVPQLGIVTQPCTLADGIAYGVHLVERWRRDVDAPPFVVDRRPRPVDDTLLLTLTEDDSESGRRRLVRKTKEWLEELREKLAPGLPALPGTT